MKRTLPDTMPAYLAMVKDAMFEVENLRATIEYDDDEMLPANAFIDDLQAQVRQLLEELENETHEFKDSDLPFMQTIAAVPTHFLPFKILLFDINAVHRTVKLDQSVGEP